MEWRQRDQEFEDTFSTKVQLLEAWENGWKCLFDAINSLNQTDLESIVYIRNQGHSVVEAINRQLCHYAYHIGQLVYLGKMIRNQEWKSLSIPKNKSDLFNKKKFEQEKTQRHFTEDN